MISPTLGRARARLSAALAAGLALTGGLVALDLGTAPGALGDPSPTVQVFDVPGTSLFTVPAGVTLIEVTVVGAAGGSCFNGQGGRGATVTAILGVTAGSQLRVGVGGRGPAEFSCQQAGTPGGGGGGGAGGTGNPFEGATGGGGGGGASLVSAGPDDPTQATALVVAGAGGGASYGTPGGDADHEGGAGDSGAGGAGTQDAGGAGGFPYGGGSIVGGTGTAFAGGDGGDSESEFGIGGGGGGGGYYGGGGGGGSMGYAGGGGGGSSHVQAGTYVLSPPEPTSSNASVTITYPAEYPLPTATIDRAGGGTYLVGATVPTSFECSEAVGGPGLASCNDSHDSSTETGGTGTLDTSTPGVHTYTVTATSSSARTGSASISYTVIYAPTAAISSPGAHGTYELGRLVTTVFSCAEGTGGPGLVACQDSNGKVTTSGGTGTLSTETAGPHSYTVTATSAAGFASTTSLSYTVTPAKVSIRTARAAVSRGRTKTVVACSGAMVCRGTLTLLAKKRLVATAAYSTSVGKSATVRIKLTRAGTALLRKAKKHRLSTQATATVTGGATARRTILLTLR